MVIRAVALDVGGVLALVEPMDFDRRWEVHLGLTAGTISTVMADVWDAGAIGRVTEAEVHRAMGERLGLDAGQVEAMMADMWKQYLGVPNVELIDYVRGLRPAYRTGILSNSFVGAREREGFGDLVDELIYSHEAGMTKPDPALWELACRRLAVTPGEMVFVDDAPGLVESATEFGIRGVLFTDTRRAVADVEALLCHG
ncbi:HAD-IA family hydrolase [Actinoplanes sp. NPDC023936]|uniref:HAD-IA family hydrolase n=1 Tax=Actinoplanes sp. NPDC023936 TaxID=3154910 RepID=UPI0033EEAC39